MDKFDDQFLFLLLNLAEAVNTVATFSLLSTLYLIFRIPIYLFQFLCYQQFTLDTLLAILSLLPYLVMVAYAKNTLCPLPTHNIDIQI